MLFVVVLVFVVFLVVPLVLVVRPCFSFFFFVHDPSDLEVTEQQEGNFGKLSFFKTRIQKPSRPQKGLN